MTYEQGQQLIEQLTHLNETGDRLVIIGTYIESAIGYVYHGLLAVLFALVVLTIFTALRK